MALVASSSIPLSYLGELSSSVYGSEAQNEIVVVGADRFTIHQTEKNLVIAICGTSSPLQHVMNVMPHAFQGIHAVGRAFSSKNLDASGNGTSGASQEIFRSHKEAYDAGNREGWIEPARAICTELIRCLSDGSNREFDWNKKYERIFVTGHSRGGLLAYYVGLMISRGGNYGEYASIPPFQGMVKVVSFGMPPPLSEPSAEDLDFVAQNVVSIWHRHDPVANGSILSWGKWNPISVRVGVQKDPPRPKQPKASSIRGRAGFWGVIGNAVSTVAEAVGDKANEIASDIDKYHAVGEYVRNVSTVDLIQQPSMTLQLPNCVVCETNGLFLRLH